MAIGTHGPQAMNSDRFRASLQPRHGAICGQDHHPPISFQEPWLWRGVAEGGVESREQTNWPTLKPASGRSSKRNVGMLHRPSHHGTSAGFLIQYLFLVRSCGLAALWRKRITTTELYAKSAGIGGDSSFLYGSTRRLRTPAGIKSE